MARLTVTMHRREQIAEGTWAFTFAFGAHPFHFRPGQAIDLFLVHPAYHDSRGSQHAFSIAGTAGPSTIQIATRIRESVYKKNLVEMPLGTSLEVDGPWGDFVLPETPGDYVFLAGGIGVTPFRAMIQDASARSLPHDLSLLHQNRTPEETPFLSELKRVSANHRRFAYLPTMTRAESSQVPWVGARRRLDAAFLDEVLDANRAEAHYMVAGPAGFVRSSQEALNAIGIPADRVQVEEFPGY